MNKRNYKREWVGCSNLKEKYEDLQKAHEEFLQMLKDGYEVADVKVKRRRPRIQRPTNSNFRMVMVFGKPMRLTIQEYNDHWLMAFGK